MNQRGKFRGSSSAMLFISGLHSLHCNRLSLP
jgi:hypothetical protein